MNREKTGREGEDFAKELLVQAGYTIELQGTKDSAYDILAEKNGKHYAINVKTGKASFGVNKRNLSRLLEFTEKGYIPTLMFLPFPAVECEYMLFPLEKFGWRWNESIVCDDVADGYSPEEAEKRRNEYLTPKTWELI